MPAEARFSAAPRAGAGVLQSLPILLLDVHRHCNCRCLMCDIWKRPRDTTRSAELDLLELEGQRAALAQLGVREVVLTGGEPLLHTQLKELIRILRACGVRITLLTSGLLLSRHAATAAMIDEIIVSLDGPAAVHDRIRGVRNGFGLLGEGIAAVRRHRPGLPLGARCTVQRANAHLLRQTVAAAHALNLDWISFLPADLTSKAFNRELVWPGERQADVALTGEEIAALEREIDAVAAENACDLESGYILEPIEKLRRLSRRFREHLEGLPPQAPRCNAPWVSAVLELDGALRPCFFHSPVATLKGATLQEAINSPAARHFRETLDVATNPICQRCVCSLNYRPGKRR